MCKIKINEKEKALVNCKTGEIIRPSCFVDLVLLHSYMVQRGNEKGAEDMLKKVFKGEKVITDMVDKAQKQFEKQERKHK